MGAILRLVAYLLILVSMLAVQCQQTAEDWNKQGIVKEKQLDHDEAVKAYDEALKLDPNLTMAWYNKGIALFYKGDYKKAADAFAEAITDYDEAIKLNPNDYIARYDKGKAIDYSASGSELSHDDAILAYDGAVAACDEIIKQNSSDYVAWNTKGLALRSLGEYEEAKEAYDKAIEFNPQYADAWFNNGDVLDILSNNESETIQSYDEAIEVNPQYAAAWYNKGIALFNQASYEEAIKAYDKFTEIEPQDVEVWYLKGAALEELGKYPEAIKAYDKIIEADPLRWAAWDNKAISQKRLGIERTYYPKDFFTMIDGRGVTFFLSFVEKETGNYVTPEGRLLILLYRGIAKKFSRMYNITEGDYDSYVGGIAIKKWISFEELSGISEKSKVTGQFGFQDKGGIMSTAKEERD